VNLAIWTSEEVFFGKIFGGGGTGVVGGGFGFFWEPGLSAQR